MKRILILILLSLPLFVRAQSASERFFDHYSKAEGFACVQLERKMMRMMSRQAAEKGDEKLAELLDGIQYIRIVALGGGSDTEAARFVADAEALASTEDAGYQLVMATSDAGQTTRFYLREAKFSFDSELLMLTYGEKETVVMNIYGMFDLKQVSRLSTIRPRQE